MQVKELMAFMKNERLKSGMSMRDLHKKSGVRSATICEIENGKTKGQIGTIVSVLDGLGYELVPVKKSLSKKV